MRRLILLAFVTILASRGVEAQRSTRVTVERLQEILAGCEAGHQGDAEIAHQLSGMELTERLNTASLARLKSALPGERAQEALVAMADSSAFLAPPAGEIPARPVPAPAALRQMLVAVVNYVNTTARQLPNFLATRETTRFEDRPQEDVQGQIGTTTLIYLPLHVVGRSNVSVAYRDGHEVVAKLAAKDKRGESQEQGLFTEGVFGPILSTVVGDALKGKITWSRWEEGASSVEAVFHYVVPKEKSHYLVGFCCVLKGLADKDPEAEDWHRFAEIAAYHGEVAFDPASGSILRITLEADMAPNEVVSTNGMMVEYGPVDIGGKTYICPLRSASLLLAHTTQPGLGSDAADVYRGPAKTFLNDATFVQYRRFGSETRILAGNSAEAAGSPPAAAPEPALAVSPAKTGTENDSGRETEGTTAGANAATTANLSAAPVAGAPVAAVPPRGQGEPEVTIETEAAKPGAAPGLSGPVALEQPSSYTLRLTSRLVDVFLTAVDRKGHPVADLKADDLEVFDNGRRQEIKFFGPVEAPLAATADAPASSPEMTFSNRTVNGAADSPEAQQAQAGATILLIDESHIAWKDMNNARAQMLQFLAGARPGERIGLYSLSSLGFRVLEEVTADHAAVSARLRGWMPTAQSIAQAQDEETRTRQQFSEMRNVSDLSSVNGNQADLPDGLSPVDPQLLKMGSNPARASLIILGGVARHLAPIPGHKNLVWFSSDNVFADWRDQEASIDRDSNQLDSFAVRAQEAMNDAHVSVYPMDVSQLETSAIGADIQHRNVELNPTNPRAGTLPNDSTAGRTKAEMLEDVHPIQWPVREVAEGTGGRAIRRSGDLASALSQIVEEGDGAYRLSFSPDRPADGQYHAITVKLIAKQHGVNLQYRTGYLYAKEPTDLKDRFQQAVWQPADANELTVGTEVLRAADGTNLKINVAAEGLNLEQQSDRWMDKVDVFFIQRDDAGLHAQVELQTLDLRLKPSTYKEVQSTGIPCEHLIHIKPDMASVRILVVDRNSGRMGSVTIPAWSLGPER